MFKKLLITIAFLLWSTNSYSTDLTGTVNYPDGSHVNGRISFQLVIRGSQSPSDGCLGPASIVPTTAVVFNLINGVIQVGAHVIGNDCILPARTFYIVQVRDNNANLLFNENWTIAGSSYDIGTPVLTTNAPLMSFSGALLLTPVGALDQSVTGSILPGVNNTYNLGSDSFAWANIKSTNLFASTGLKINSKPGLNWSSTSLQIGSASNTDWTSVDIFPGTTTPQNRVDAGGLRFPSVATVPTIGNGLLDGSHGRIYFDGSVFQFCQLTVCAPVLTGVSGTGGWEDVSTTIRQITTTDQVVMGLATTVPGAATQLTIGGPTPYLYVVSAQTNASIGVFGYDPLGAITIGTATAGSGTLVPIRFAVSNSNTEAARFETTGRLLVGLSTTDVSSVLGSIVASHSFISTTATSNASVGSFGAIAGQYVSMGSGRTGSGAYLPITFFTSGGEAVRIDTAQTLLAGTTSNDDSTQVIIEGVKASANGALILARNPTVGSVSFSAFQAVSGNASSPINAYFGVSSASFTPASGLKSLQGFVRASGGATNGLVLITDAGNVGFVPGTNLMGEFDPTVGLNLYGSLAIKSAVRNDPAGGVGYLHLYYETSSDSANILAVDYTGPTYKPLNQFGSAINFNANGTFVFQVSTLGPAWAAGFGDSVNSGAVNLSFDNLDTTYIVGNSPYVMLHAVAPDGTHILIPAFKDSR